MRPAAPGPDGGDQRRASGREKHNQKITVYLSAEELLDLERARLALLRYGASADRGRIVREAIAVLLADLDARGKDSLLARRIASTNVTGAGITGAGIAGADIPGADITKQAMHHRAQDPRHAQDPRRAQDSRHAQDPGPRPSPLRDSANVVIVNVDDAGGGPEGPPRTATGFEVHLDVFEGPFDLLLALISKHKLDITEVALSQVTDEFIAYISERSDGWDLDQVSYFLVVAATLLDLKAARLLPCGEVEDEEDLALLEARDLLFARLLQYRAYKEVAATFAARMTAAARRFPRRVPLEPRFAQLFPEVLLGLGPAEFARLASLTLAPKPPPKVSTDHIHAPVVSIKDQTRIIAALLAGLGRASFRQLTANAAGGYEIVASFLALLDLYRDEAVSFEQVTPLGELYVTWTGNWDADSVNEPNESDDLQMSSESGLRPPGDSDGPEMGEDAETPDIPDEGPGLRASLEAILLVADEPVPAVMLAQVLERPRNEVLAELNNLAASYTAEGRGFDLREIAGGWRFYTRQDCAPLVERFVSDGQEVRLTQAALETLAVVAYRQPVSRVRVSAVRGVNCDGVMRTLVLRGLVEEAGAEKETGAILYRTTGYFLERLGLAGLEDLPALAPFLPEDIEDIEDENASS